MAIYLPIDVPLPIRASRSDIDAFRWSRGKVGIRLLGTDGSGRMLDIDFARPSIVRLLDEMALSTEEALDENIGLVAEHCFYLVRGAPFAAAQSEAWLAVHPGAAHYRVITGWGCADVVSAAKPVLTVVAAVT